MAERRYHQSLVFIVISSIFSCQGLFKDRLGTNLEILISTPSAASIHALDEGDVVGLVEDEGAIWAHRAVSGHHLRKKI